jgi:hypothetical protein
MVMIAAIFVPVFSTSLSLLAFGEFLCGIPWGVFQVSCVSHLTGVGFCAPYALAATWTFVLWLTISDS